MEIVLGIVIIVGIVLLVRLFGAWMLRIDEVISQLKEIKELLKKEPNADASSKRSKSKIEDEVLKKAELFDKTQNK